MKTNQEILRNSRISNHRDVFGMMNGANIKLNGCGICSVIWNHNEEGWEHVSVAPKSKKIPSWNDMCQLKDIFFYDGEEVYQIHPPHSHYVNIKDNCLHLWKPKNGKTLNDLVKEQK